MVNFSSGNSHWGNQAMPCTTKGCGHASRDHNRSTKQPDGSYNGACTQWDCNCKLYRKPKTI